MFMGIQRQADTGGRDVFSSALVWHLTFWFLLLMLTVSVWIAGSDDSGGNWLGFGIAVAVLGVAYQVVGRPGVETRDNRLLGLYYVVLATCLGLASFFVAQAAFFLILGMPQAVHLPRRLRHGLFWSAVVLGSVVVGSLASRGFTTTTVTRILPWVAITIVVTVLMAVTVDRILNQSEQRGRLIRELKRTRVELAEANHAAGVAAERERLAREIHDTLAQGFTSIVMLAQAARGDDAAVPRTLQLIEETARENLAEARALVAAFTPVALDDSTLADALGRLGARFERETGVQVDVDVDPGLEGSTAEVSPIQQVVLLRAAQEALANVRKHADADHVVITLDAAEGGAEIRIHDDGRGFDPTDDRTHGFGLAGMRGRVEDSGGTLELESAPGSGTDIRVTVPRAAREPEVTR